MYGAAFELSAKMYCDIYTMFYLCLTVIIKQKPTVNSQKIEKRIKAYHYGKPSAHKGRQQDRMRGTKGLQNRQKTIKAALVSPYLSIITLNVNELNSPIKDIQWLTGLKKARPNYMLPVRYSLQL